MTSKPATPGATASAVHSRRAAFVLLVLLSLTWGFHWVVVKTGLDYMPPLTYGTLRLLGGLLTMLVILGVQRRISLPPRADVPIILSIGFGQIASGILITHLALEAVPAGRSSVLLYSMPLWVAVLLYLRFRTKPRRNELIGLVLGVGGIVILINPTVINWTIPGEVLGTLGLICAAIFWAGVAIHVRRHRWVSRPLDLQPWMLIAALVPVTLAALLLESGRTIRWEPATVLILLYSGPLATAFAHWASQSITRSLGALASGIGFLAVPVIGLASGAVFLHESLGPLDIAGFALVLAGIAATSLVPPPKAAGARDEAVAAPVREEARA